MVSSTGPTLALPAAGADQRRVGSLLPMAVLLLGSAGTMLFGALIAAYLHMRRLSGGVDFPPADAHIDQYLGNMMVITMLMASVTVEWAASALRRGDRRQTTTALAITIGLGVAFLNLAAYTFDQVEFDPTSHPYGAVVGAMSFLLAIVVVVGIGLAALTLFRVAGRQLDAGNTGQLRAAAWYWQFTVAASVAVWYTVIVLK